MTTREATSLLTRPAAIGDGAGRWRDQATVILWGAIQWPWLLRSLAGGRRTDKQALLAHLGLPADALPHLGSWKADTDFLWRIVRHIAVARPQTVVELGAGASTLVAARALALHGGGRLVSYDQHADFASGVADWLRAHSLDAEVHAAPLGPGVTGWRGPWYRLEGLPDRIDLLLVDGPPWSLHPLVRGAAETLFPRLPVGGAVLMDDGSRPGERLVMRRWARRWPDFRFEHLPGGAGAILGVRLG